MFVWKGKSGSEEVFIWNIRAYASEICTLRRKEKAQGLRALVLKKNTAM